MRPTRLLPLCGALLGGCALEPDDPIYLSGTVLEADGTPWRGGPATLMRPRKTDVHLNEYGQEVFSRRFEPWEEVTPDEEGLFLHRLTAREVGADDLEHPHPWADNTAFQLHLPRTDGGKDFLAFQFELDTDLPPLRPWVSNVRAVDEAGGVRLSWEPVVRTADLPESNHFVHLRGETGVAWRLHAQSGEPVLYPELLEDFTDGRAHVQAVARGSRVWFRNTLYYSAVSEAPPLPLPFTGPVPASRGADCASDGGPIQPCAYTDGRLESVRVRPKANAMAQELILVLKAPVRPRRVLLRGLETSAFPGEVLHVEGSVDGGATWLPLGDSAPFTEAGSVSPHVDDPAELLDTERFLDVALPPGAPAVGRIRLWATAKYSDGSTGKSHLRGLREVSIFGD
jgi:hypothetical protein